MLGGLSLSPFRRARERAALRILARMEAAQRLSPALLRRRLKELSWEIRGGKSPAAVLEEVFSLVGGGSRQVLGMSQYPVQIQAGIALFHGHIVEMQTGEGKTLAATMPVVLRALAGKGCHVVTSNDYLAGRDAEHMGRLYDHLGLSCGCVLDQMSDDDRRVAYDRDITYGTAAQLGFDFLRDRLKTPAGTLDAAGADPFRRPHPAAVQRGHYCAIVDEADCVLIDDAGTPLLIGLMHECSFADLGLYAWCRAAAATLHSQADFLYDPRTRRAALTDAGCRKLVLRAKPPALDVVHIERIYQGTETALAALVDLRRDRDYVVDKGEIVIVDESLGRKMEGRKWQHGLHQMVEAKEGLQITDHTVHAAQVTVQSFFSLYAQLSGMTGTAVPARREFRRVYKRAVTIVPTHRPCRRVSLRPRVFRTMQAKWRAVAESISQLIAQGRAVLVGTPSVDESEALSKVLAAAGVPHQVLNARQDEFEADMISRAGIRSQVTIATNMAGRGTDIHIDEAVRTVGGLHVIATAMHSSRRIDRQLVGRCARQGDPGSCQFLLSLEDQLLQALSPRRRRALQATSSASGPGELPANWMRVFRMAQRRLEARDAQQRTKLLKAEKQQREAHHKMGLDPYLEIADDE